MVTLRLAGPDDWGRLYEWRNDPAAMENSGSTDVVGLPDHWKWFAEVMKNPSSRIYIAEESSESLTVGTGRIDVGKKAVATLSLTVDARHRGRGFGAQIVWLLAKRAKELGAETLQAKVRHANRSSLRAFAENGFAPKKFEGDFVTLERGMP